MELTLDQDAPMVTARAMTSTADAANAQHGETPVANIPYRIYNPFPRTNQVLMHFRALQTNDIAENVNAVVTTSFRLNSIVDVATQLTYGADPSRTDPDVVDNELNVPAMRNFWSCIYDYYTVVRSRFHLRVRPKNSAANNVDTVDVFMTMHGKQIPPRLTTSGQPIPWNYRKRFPHTIMKKMKMMTTGGVVTGVSSVTDHFEDAFVDFYGEWYPGIIDHEVEEDELKKTWHKMTETPRIPEFVTFTMQRSSDTTVTRKLDLEWEFSIDYEVQLKSLRDQFQFIRPGMTLNFDPIDLTQNNGTNLSITAAQVYNQLNPNTGG